MKHGVLAALSSTLVFGAMPGCRTTATDDASAVRDDLGNGHAELPALTCATGEPSPFHLSTMDPPLAITEVGFSEGAFVNSQAMSPTGAVNMRFDTCVTDDDVRVQRIVFKTRRIVGFNPFFPGQQEIFVFEADDSVTEATLRPTPEGFGYAAFRFFVVPRAQLTPSGFFAAIFNEPSDVRLTLPVTESRRLELRSGARSGQPFLWTWVADASSGEGPDPFSVVAGALSFGDPFGGCPAGLTPGKVTYDLGSARITLDTCIRSEVAGNGPAWFQTHTGAKVVDQGPVPIEKTLSKDEIEAALVYHSDQHHHFDDAWRLTLPEAVYEWGCVEALDPSTPESCEDRMAYRKRYGDGAWETGQFTGGP